MSIVRWLKAQSYGKEVLTSPPASAELIQAVRVLGGGELDDALAALLAESDGITGEYGLGVVWSCAQIVRENEAFRTNADFKSLYMSFDSLLFFGDAGNGDQFGLRVLEGEVPPDVYVWNHEDDSRTWVASNVRDYLDGWLSGRLSV